MAINGTSHRSPTAELTLSSTTTRSNPHTDKCRTTTDPFAWLCPAAVDSHRNLSPSYFAHRSLDQMGNSSIHFDQNPTLVPWCSGMVSPPSQLWPLPAPTDVLSANSACAPIATASAYSTLGRQPDITRAIQAPSPVMGSRSQPELDGATSMNEQICPQSATPTIRFPTRPKMPRRSSSKGQTPNSAVTKLTRTPHNLIERRYRHKLQSELDNLTSKIPGWEIDVSTEIDIENTDHSLKGRSKASAIAAAAKHIEHLEMVNGKKDDFIMTLQEQIEGLQKLVRCDDCSILRCLQAKGMISLTEPLEEDPPQLSADSH